MGRLLTAGAEAGRKGACGPQAAMCVFWCRLAGLGVRFCQSFAGSSVVNSQPKPPFACAWLGLWICLCIFLDQYVELIQRRAAARPVYLPSLCNPLCNTTTTVSGDSSPAHSHAM